MSKSSSEIGKPKPYHSAYSEDEDESLSLSDLPLLSSSARHQEDEEQPLLDSGQGNSATEDFDFGSLAASLDTLESEMCVADEVFYRGQILPFRHSVSSACTTAAKIAPYNLARSVSRSESMDRIAGSGFRSSSTASSSRSSSTRSNSINSSASADKLSQRHSNYSPKSNGRRSSRFQHQFVASRSPRPYGEAADAPRRSTSSAAASPAKKSALWELFRLGLVQTPEIELEDLKVRYGKHHGIGRGISNAVILGNGNGSGKSVNRRDYRDKPVNRKKKLGGMKFNCKCSVEAVEPAEKAGRGKQREGHKKSKNDVTRHHRTFEWLRDLSHAVVLNDL